MDFKGNELARVLSIGLLLPVLLVAIVVLYQPQPATEPQPSQSQNTAVTEPPRSGMMLTVLCGGEKKSMELETYLCAVVLGEMPASFEMDALRAQAVAARTYTLKRCANADRHGLNAICTDPSCCQAYTEPMDYISGGGSWASVSRVEQAVADTQGEVLVYGGELIEATYFSCAGDMTEDALAVWGQDYPYLQAVTSPGEENAVFYADSKTFTAEQFQMALGMKLEGEAEKWFGEATYTNGGGVEILPICGIPYRGTTLRTLLGLRSTAFSVTVEQGKILIRTKGFGHRVGLSQYGANAMAKAGKTYEQILTHYYTGTEIVQYHDE